MRHEGLKGVVRGRRTRTLVGSSKGLIHHSDHGVQYLSIRYTARLEQAGVQASVGSVGDS